MIDYSPGYWGVGFIFQINGSVAPKALAWALPNAILTIVLHQILNNWFYEELEEFRTSDTGISWGLAGFSSILGFLLVFRTRLAYDRWWEGITLLQVARGEWFNAYSNLLAFCTRAPARQMEVDKFQHLLVRLMSLLYGSALQQVCKSMGDRYDIINLAGVDESYIQFLADQCDKVEVVIQWIQQLVVDRQRDGVLDIAPPILSRVFQELSRGIVNIQSARKISEVPYPFPYAQLLSQALLIHWLMAAVFLATLCQDSWWAAALAFTLQLCLWSVNYVSQEIEDPFGDDSNDLPLRDMQDSFNHSLGTLLLARARTVPDFKFTRKHRILNLSRLERGVSTIQATRESQTTGVLSESDTCAEWERASLGPRLNSMESLVSRGSMHSLATNATIATNATTNTIGSRAHKKHRGFQNHRSASNLGLNKDVLAATDMHSDKFVNSSEDARMPIRPTDCAIPTMVTTEHSSEPPRVLITSTSGPSVDVVDTPPFSLKD